MILICGEALIDFTPITINNDKGFLLKPGGSPYNIAIALSRLGGPSAFLSKISKDPFGDILINNLKENGVDISYVIRGDEPTTLAFVFLENNEPKFLFYGHNSADANILISDIPPIYNNILAVHFGSISLVREPSATTYEKLMMEFSGKFIITFDPNVRPNLIPNKEKYIKRLERWLSFCNIVKVSHADLSWLYPNISYEEIAREWLNLGPKIIIVTLGENGAFALTEKGLTKVSAIKVSVVDTVGAGDSFMGGILYWLWKNEKLNLSVINSISLDDLTNALKFSTIVSAITCTRAGANPPTLKEVENFINEK
jgi:fructokinase